MRYSGNLGNHEKTKSKNNRNGRRRTEPLQKSREYI